MAKLVSVYGPPNSGVTTLCMGMAQVLSQKKYSVCVVCCNNLVPTIPTIIPQAANKVGAASNKVKSMGKVLKLINFTTNDILDQLVCSKVYDNIALIGYGYGENYLTYPEPTEYDIYNFFGKLSEMTDYIILDCDKNLLNLMTKVGLEKADSIIKVCGTGYKDITYFASMNSIMPEGEVKKSEQITVFPNVGKRENIDYLSEFYGNIDFVIKHDEEISKMFTYGEYLLKDFPKSYTHEVKKIIEQIDFY